MVYVFMIGVFNVLWFDRCFIVLCYAVGKAKGVVDRYVAQPMNTTFLPEVRNESMEERYARMRHNCFATVAQCVQPSTRSTYDTGGVTLIRIFGWYLLSGRSQHGKSQWISGKWRSCHSRRDSVLMRIFAQAQ